MPPPRLPWSLAHVAVRAAPPTLAWIGRRSGFAGLGHALAASARHRTLPEQLRDGNARAVLHTARRSVRERDIDAALRRAQEIAGQVPLAATGRALTAAAGTVACVPHG